MKISKLFSLVFLVVFVSCGNEDDNSVDSGLDMIDGRWSRVDIIPNGLTKTDFKYFETEAVYQFNQDATYSFKVIFYGFKDDYPNEVVGQSENIGTYKVQGDSLFTSALNNTSWENEFNPKPKTIDLEGALNSFSYEVKDNVLTLHYVSYPADAPLSTQMSYSRVDRTSK